MKTPKHYNDLIKQNKITKDMIGEVLYSINKRAKNHRDKKREYSRSRHYTKFDYAELSEEKEKEYYKMKSDILAKFEPIKIHEELKFKVKRRRIYSKEEIEVDGEFGFEGYEYIGRNKEYFEIMNNKSEYTILKRGSFSQDYETIDFVDISEGKELYKKLYFLYFEIGDFNFHQPLKEEDLEVYKDIDIEILTNFKTSGEDINDLLSVQFCNKVYTKLMNNELEIMK